MSQTACDLRFRAMGTEAQVLVFAEAPVAEDLAALGRDRVELLEQSWSRFRPDSGLSLLNAAAGQGPQPVSEDLLLLVTRMHAAWQATDGLFDPTVLASMTALGYDADFATVSARPAGAITDIVLTAAPGMSAVTIDEDAATVALPAGIGLDPGAIGKGLAADVIADELHEAGATGVLVNLGGDIAIRGTAGDDAWTIDVADERTRLGEDASTMTIDVAPGAERVGVATSTTLKRRWAQGRRHHVIDPRTGGMSRSDVLQATVVAASACDAEVLATTALLQSADDADAWLREHGVTALLLTETDTRITSDSNHDEEPNHG